MNINGQHYYTIWEKEDQPEIIQILDQRYLPFELKIADLRMPDDFTFAIKEMQVRGAPLIGVTAAYGLFSATLQAANMQNPVHYLKKTAQKLKNTRPTAVDLFFAVDLSFQEILKKEHPEDKIEVALQTARQLKEKSIQSCRKIGEYGLALIEEIHKKKDGKTIQILTHCNAGWLACIDYGTATAPIYLAFEKGIPVHVWVDETRPRSQGARLTAYELSEHGVPHTVISDNSGGHLMQHGQVDMVVVGTDRTTRAGDVANKIGTYLKALAAKDNDIPFYVALPPSSIDWAIRDGIRDITIETRSEKEVTHIEGWNGSKITEIQVTPFKSPAMNHGFDVTPSRLITGLITDRGICPASEKGLLGLFPEHKNKTNG